MSLTDDINNLPNSPREVMPGHLDHHATIHSALKNHNSHLTTIDQELDSVDTELSQRIDGKANSVHRHVSGDITDAVSRIGNTPNRVVKTNADGKLLIPTSSITENGDPTNKVYVDSADTALRTRMDAADTALKKRLDLLFPSSIRAGQVLKWDGTKYIPSWMDQHANLHDDTY